MPAQIIADASDRAIAEWIARRIAAALAAPPDDAVTITVPGGSTPFPILAELARHDLDWSRVTIWPGDDRVVPDNHPASNVGRIREAMGRTGAHIPALHEGAHPPHFALTWLGMGGDGHIASLFPNTDPRADDPALLRAITPDPLPPEAPFSRLTLTIPALANTDAVLFVIRGKDKRDLFDAALSGAHDLPVARFLKACAAPVTCFT
ncbi:MAG: 6-phosphogluconolactonase [Novosphingobium sp.]